MKYKCNSFERCIFATCSMSTRAGTEKVSHTGKTSLEEGAQASLLRRTRNYFLDCTMFLWFKKANSSIFTGRNKPVPVESRLKLNQMSSVSWWHSALTACYYQIELISGAKPMYDDSWLHFSKMKIVISPEILTTKSGTNHILSLTIWH